VTGATTAATASPSRSPRARITPTALITCGVLVLLAAAPLLGAGVYTIVVLTSLLAYALLAMSINLVAGHTGLLTLAHGAYAGVGAYAAALAARHLTSNGLVQLLIAVTAGALIAALTGWIAVRASKTYFLMLSLAIGELLHILAIQWRSVTRGSDGLSAGGPFELIPGQPTVLAGYVYWVAFAVFLVFGGLVLLVVRSPFGSALRGIRDNESRMRGLGYPTALYKYAVWIFSGAVAGAAGWILIAQLPRFIAPSQLSFHLAGLMLLAVVIGGLGSMWGSCVGAAIVVLMTDVVSQDLGGRGPLLLGALFVLAVYALPRGLAGIGRGKPSARATAPSDGEDPGAEQGAGTKESAVAQA
jgi:branched-chain amino acid transport system permease protein